MKTRTPLARLSRRHAHALAAFTRVELCVCLMCVAVMSAVVFPALAANRSQSDVAQCLNNLRRIGMAVHMWGTDHQYDPPWRTFISQGGTQPDAGTSKPGNAWFEFLYLSNQLVTPGILVCPADDGAKIASNFSTYSSAGFRGVATSYCINLHTIASLPATMVSSDRNIRFMGTTSCAYVSSGAWGYYPLDINAGGWTNAVHGLQGNILLMDGSVSVSASDQLHSTLRKSDENGTIHLLTAR